MQGFEIDLKSDRLIQTEQNRPTMQLTPLSNNSFVSMLPEGIEVKINFTEYNEVITGLNVNFSLRELSYFEIK